MAKTTTAAMSELPTPIWLDCDTGHDDSFGILLAARHPQVKLLGISTVYGNAPLDKTTYNTRAILKAIGRQHVPVYAGAAKPFCREAEYSPEIHGESGLDGTTCLPTPDVAVRTDKTAIDAMYEALITTPKGTAWLIPTGALTNAALLFAIHPDLVEHLAGLSVMGGAIGGNFNETALGKPTDAGRMVGNVTPWAEFNIYIDPESAKSIFTNPAIAAKTTLITLDVTHLFLATKEVRNAMLHGFDARTDPPQPSTVRKLFVEILTFFGKTYADVFDITAGPPVHDPLAVAAAFEPSLFNDNDGERWRVDIVTEGAHGKESGILQTSECGRTVVNEVGPGASGVRVPRGVNAYDVWRLIEHCLGLAEKAVD